ncbi:MAG: hypothetical protein K2Q20_13375 [Phycisphaerales bacterium]|nr:hypothetical protein [Phycisphaerales bacterium]
MVRITSVEFARRLEEILALVEKGEDVVILRDGREVAMLGPSPSNQAERVDDLMKRIDELRSRLRPLDAPIKSRAREGAA